MIIRPVQFLLLIVFSCFWSLQCQKDTIIIDRSIYIDKIEGFWLGQCIANWTGLVTEMDKIGNIGEIKTGNFYTRSDWGAPDLPSIWSEGQPSELSPTIEFVYAGKDSIWGADDDTDIEYMYQHLLFTNKTCMLTPDQIQSGWLKHIKSEEENFLWVSNQQAFDLMQNGILPPETSNPGNNPHYEMIDAQLTTEIFGLFAPGHPEIALQLAYLPIRTTARNEAASIAEFYVIMHSLASLDTESAELKKSTQWMASEARKILPDSTYPARMYDFVLSKYNQGIPWEQTRDSIYQRYQVEEKDGYKITSKNLYCNGCFAAGINFAASLISLFYGEGDLKKTIKIGALTGWDSDNPTATWGGLLGFMIGKKNIENTFKQTFSNQYNIHRTRQGFPNNGIDNFTHMAKKAIQIIDQVVIEEMKGKVNQVNNSWEIPKTNQQIELN